MRAVDAAGNVDPTPAEWSWEVGGIPPAVLIESGPDLTTTDRSARFQFSADGRELTYMCALDGGEPSPCMPGKAYNGLPLGPHDFEVSVLVNEEFALEEPRVSTWEWTVIDTTGLDTTITEGPAAETAGVNPEAGGDATVPFVFHANDSRATFECAIDGEAFEECENPYIAEGLALGDHFFRVRAVLIDPNDNTVNVDPTPANWRFTTVEAPETTIDIGPEGEMVFGTARFVFSSTVSGSTFECALDLGPFEPCANPLTLTGMTDGEHILEVRAKSPHGVVDTTPEEWSWDVAGNLPETTIVSGPTASTTSTVGRVHLLLERARRVRVLAGRRPVRGLRGGPDPAARSGPDRPHADRARDSARTRCACGRSTRATCSTRRRRPTPGRSCRRPRRASIPARPTPRRARRATIEFSSGDADATFQCSLDGAAYSTCQSPKIYDNLAIGWHWVEVRAVDSDGHVDISPAMHNWTVQRPAETLAARHDDHAEAAGSDVEHERVVPSLRRRARHHVRVQARQRRRGSAVRPA